MNVKKEVMKNIENKLRHEHAKLSANMRDNTYQINELTRKQTIVKRELVEIDKLIASLPKE